jgi:hypothetical protein
VDPALELLLVAPPAEGPRGQGRAATPAEPVPLDGGPVMGVRAAARAGGAGLLVSLSALNALDYAGSAAFAVVGPDVQRSLGLSDTGLGGRWRAWPGSPSCSARCRSACSATGCTGCA